MSWPQTSTQPFRCACQSSLDSVVAGRSSNGHCFMPLCKKTSLYSQGDSYPKRIFRAIHLYIHIFYYPLCSFIVQMHLHWITLTGLCPLRGISRIQRTAGACLYGFRTWNLSQGRIHGLMASCVREAHRRHLLYISRLHIPS